jgi:ribonucleoside-triphosphate reductase
VKNWNAGKTQEYKDRMLYDPEHKKASDCQYLLFTTSTCVNCKIAKKMLDDAGIGYVTVNAEDDSERIAKYEIRQAPTLVVNASGKTDILAGIDKIRAYCNGL